MTLTPTQGFRTHASGVYVRLRAIVGAVLTPREGGDSRRWGILFHKLLTIRVSR